MAVFSDPADTAKAVAKSEGLTAHVLAGIPLEKLKISGTTTIVLVDRSGIVLNAWIGVASASAVSPATQNANAVSAVAAVSERSAAATTRRPGLALIG